MKVIHGDCAEELKKLESDSVDALVTDPPAGIGFMGRAWDSDKGGRDEWIAWLQSVMEEAKRVMKPGAHGLVWSLPRTSHWTGTALENAGFEVRDCIYHVFGSGFPKSHDISKAIDKMKGAERDILGIDQKRVRKDNDQNTTYAKHEGQRGEITAPATDEARQWDGWGTALKPAVECWWLVRKPCSEKTVAENVLKWGTGAINIDGSRVPTAKDDTPQAGNRTATFGTQETVSGGDGSGGYNPSTLGRFPSHLIHDGAEEVVSGFPDTDGGKAREGVPGGHTFGGSVNNHNKTGKGFWHGGSGSAARFFYCAKPSKSEREAGLKEAGLNDRKEGGKSIVEPSGKTRFNNHPTVKSLSLMRYLIKLITPPNGTVLDPFAGSGSTLIAAKQLGHPFIGIEREDEYVKIAQARLDATKSP